METLLPLNLFTRVGSGLLTVLFIASVLTALSGLTDLVRPGSGRQRLTGAMLWLTALLFLVGFGWICWFHFQIYLHLPLQLSPELADYLNRRLALMNRGAEYAMPLYDPAAPPRYLLPLWLENEKYFFWFLCYCWLALIAHFRLRHGGVRAALQLLLAAQVAVLVWAANPFNDPLAKFFEAVTPWFSLNLDPGRRFGLFMQLYPKMIFYYNAEYMWLHPPMLFLSYGCITVTFVTSVCMLVRRDPAVEALGYSYAKLGFFMLTVGMLLGYPWALKAWGPNWWWDPKICSSIMMWAIYSTYLHTRLYSTRPFMWYFSSILGILCFLAMLFTFVSSFFFPGEHTFV